MGAPFESLRDFLKHLEKQGELKRISEPVSTYLEMTEIHKRVLEAGGPALLFEKPVKLPPGGGVAESHQREVLREDAVGGQSRDGTPPHDSASGEASSAPPPGGSYGLSKPIPVLCNLFGTVERVAAAIGRKPEELRDVGKMLAFLRQPEPPTRFREALDLLPLAKTMLTMKPKTVKKVPCQEVVITGDDVDLSILPIQTNWPGDAAPLITWPLVVTQGPTKSKEGRVKREEGRGKSADAPPPASQMQTPPRVGSDHSEPLHYPLMRESEPQRGSGGGVREDDQKYNLGIYRMQVTGKNTTLMRWLKHRGGAQHHKRWQEQSSGITPPSRGSLNFDKNSGGGQIAENDKTGGGQQADPALSPVSLKNQEDFSGDSLKMPVAAVIGADPGTTLAAVTPVPDTLSEYEFAGLLRGKRVELVDCKTVPLKVPAHAEIVLEGYVSLEDYGAEGPYGDHTGFYNEVEQFPVFTCTAITMRKDPIYLSTYTGKPPDEPSILGEALNEVFIPLLQQQFPEIVDFWLPPEGCSYRVAVVSIKKAYPGHAKRVMMGVWSYLRQFMYTKFVIVVDHHINCRDWKEVIWAISTQMDPQRDTTFIERTPIDYLDFASPESGLGSKMGLDATAKTGNETHREWGQPIEMSEDVIARVDALWEKLGLGEPEK